jgi:uncharacterized protein with HEPN domain
MHRPERDPAYLWDMQRAARLVRSFLQGKSYKDFIGDAMLSSAIERQLEIIGEAARRISSELQEKHTEIPWRSIIGLRNILIQEYGEVHMDRLWLIATTHVDELVEKLEPLIPPEPDNE